MSNSSGSTGAAGMATDISGGWRISWVDQGNNKGAFTIEIQNGKDGSPHIECFDEGLPFDSGFYLGNESVIGQSVSFTIAVSLGGRMGTFNFKIPQMGGNGTFSGSASLCDGLKNTQGTCTSVRIS
jgi:hypothetical protein